MISSLSSIISVKWLNAHKPNYKWSFQHNLENDWPCHIFLLPQTNFIWPSSKKTNWFDRWRLMYLLRVLIHNSHLWANLHCKKRMRISIPRERYPLTQCHCQLNWNLNQKCKVITQYEKVPALMQISQKQTVWSEWRLQA